MKQLILSVMIIFALLLAGCTGIEPAPMAEETESAASADAMEVAEEDFDELDEGPIFPIAEPDYNSKLVRDFTPFKEAMAGFSAERAAEMGDLLVGSTILDIQGMMDAGQLSSTELATYYLARIQQYDVDIFNSVMELNPEALAIATQLDQERADGTVRGSIHGIPVLLKANIATADQMKTTAGAVALADWQPAEDAVLVQQLRDAGAIILGKANLSEWANYMDPSLPNGFTALGGQTRAAYGPYDPLGSSTGSAVSVAANLASASVGTETQGSIVLPAKVNSVVALKTSRGLVSGDGIIPLVDWMDVAGPMGRNVTDVAVLLTAMDGMNGNDPVSAEASPLAGTDFTQFLTPEAAQSVRVGMVTVPEEMFQDAIDTAATALGRDLTEDETALTRRSLGDALGDPQVIAEVLNAQGIETVALDFMTSLESITAPDTDKVLEYGFQDSFNTFMASHGDNAPFASLAEVAAFNNEDLANTAPYGQGHVEGSVNTAVTAEEYAAVKESNMAAGAAALRDFFAEHEVDIIVCRACTQAYAAAGFPALTVPDGYDENGIPISLIFVGDHLSEPQLLAVGYAYEQATEGRVEPDLDLRKEQVSTAVNSD